MPVGEKSVVRFESHPVPLLQEELDSFAEELKHHTEEKPKQPLKRPAQVPPSSTTRRMLWDLWE